MPQNDKKKAGKTVRPKPAKYLHPWDAYYEHMRDVLPTIELPLENFREEEEGSFLWQWKERRFNAECWLDKLDGRGEYRFQIKFPGDNFRMLEAKPFTLPPTKEELREVIEETEKDLTLYLQFEQYLAKKKVSFESQWGIIRLGPFTITIGNGGFWYGREADTPEEEVRQLIGYFDGLRAELQESLEPELEALGNFTCDLDLV